MDRHHRDDLRMTPLRSDPALYMLMKNELFQGLLGGYVDELTRTGTEDFKRFAKKTNHKFEMAEDQDLPYVLRGFSIAPDGWNNSPGPACRY